MTDNAYACDPRVIRYREEEKEKKEAQKRAKKEAARQKALEEERVSLKKGRREEGVGVIKSMPRRGGHKIRAYNREVRSRKQKVKVLGVAKKEFCRWVVV